MTCISILRAVRETLRVLVPARTVAALAWTLGASLLASRTITAQTPPLEVKLVSPSQGTIHRWITLPGSLTPYQQVTLLSRVPGYIGQISVDLGSHVTAGQEVVRIEAPELEADVRRLQAQLALVKADLKRLEAATAKAKDLVTEQSLDKARASVEITQAELDRATALVAYTRIKAPFAGHITQRMVDLGAYVTTQQLVTLTDTAVLRAVVFVPETEASLLRAGLPLKLIPYATSTASPAAASSGAPASGAKPIESTLTRVSASIDPVVRTVEVQADVPNPEGQLRAGQYFSAKIALEMHENVLLVPVDALLMEKTGPSVFRVSPEGKLKKAPVTLGFNDGTSAEILTGAAVGDKLVSVGKLTLSDGQAVRLAP